MDIPEIRSYEDEAVNIVVSVLNKAHEKLGIRLNLFQIAPFKEKLIIESSTAIDSQDSVKDTFGYIITYSFEKNLRNSIEDIINEAIKKTNEKTIEDGLKETVGKAIDEIIEIAVKEISENRIESNNIDTEEDTFKETVKHIIEETVKESDSQADCVNLVSQSAKLSLSALGPPLAINSEKFLVDAIERKWRLTDALMYVLKYQGDSQDECSQYYYFEALFSQPNVRYPVPQATVSVFFRVEDKHIEPPGIKPTPIMTFRIEGQHTDHDVRYVLLTVDWLLAVIQMKIKLFKRIEQIRIF